MAAESGEVDGGCWAWESIKPTWAKGLQSGEVRIVLQTIEKPHPELKNVLSRAVGLDELRLPGRKIGGHAIERGGDRRHFVATHFGRAG